MKEARLYRKLDNKKTQCLNCAHYCEISPGKRGLCGVRQNIDGKIYSLNYGKAVACHVDPIEKKPLFHFLPGSYSLSVAAAGCNLFCQNCQNWDISQSAKPEKEILGNELLPERIIELAVKNKIPSISYTYTEPTIFIEYALDTMKLAKRHKIRNVWVTNGYLSQESFELIYPYLSAANVDLKGFSESFYLKNCGARLQPVLDTLINMKKKKIWVEVTTLVVPTLNDDAETFQGIANFIKKELGPETPWHISRFSSEISWKLKDLEETPVETLQEAYKIGKGTGLKYVYIGNIVGLPTEDTFCPKCGKININRYGYSVKRHDKKGKCFYCGQDLDIID